MTRPELLYARLAKGLDSITTGQNFGKLHGYCQYDNPKVDMLEIVSAAMQKVTNRTPMSLEILAMWERANMLQTNLDGTAQDGEAHIKKEQCELCSAPIDFETTMEARCRSGHLFSECDCCDCIRSQG